jgi:hypothetical protein
MGHRAAARAIAGGPFGVAAAQDVHRRWMEWAILVSNQWPLPCEGSALPLS